MRSGGHTDLALDAKGGDPADEAPVEEVRQGRWAILDHVRGCCCSQQRQGGLDWCGDNGEGGM